ncbi:S-adenosyl-L-methionine-dependent methyltransferase [Polychytrium aggregatum]|uniref:S-adenosyl-L-methionine-dependent methyltransferase n=1 Tax=Polychytrium aggregatum TaxID=110093 RepID=UPI0022FE0B7C|nr:S-adenosyl-L-methionine-dependent methyltransferase [Polychytrium aggregatum]KAI9204303.1 S-adenosyl-L-methionine-dependent methyltransferase [Polychytrium aggregatum]
MSGPSFPTPDLSHLNSSHYKFVYEPAEDTFLLLDALEKDYRFLETLDPLFCVEIGSGSGCATAFLGSMLGSRSRAFFCTDVNPKAASATIQTAQKNSVAVNAVLTDLTQALQPRLNGQVDLLVFNPPYVVTTSDEVGSRSIEAAWAGGIDGREVIDRTLPVVNELLSPGGVFYMVVIRENRPEELMDLMRSRYGLESQVVMSRRAGQEGLSILRFQRPARS